MRHVAILLILFPISLFSQKVEHETFRRMMKVEKVFVDPQTVKVDTLKRTEARSPTNYQLAASLAHHLLNENRDTALKLSNTCPNLIFLTEGTVILYWDGDIGTFQGTFIQDRDHLLLQTIPSCSRVYSIQQPVLSDKPDSELNAGEDHN